MNVFATVVPLETSPKSYVPDGDHAAFTDACAAIGTNRAHDTAATPPAAASRHFPFLI